MNNCIGSPVTEFKTNNYGERNISNRSPGSIENKFFDRKSKNSGSGKSIEIFDSPRDIYNQKKE